MCPFNSSSNTVSMELSINRRENCMQRYLFKFSVIATFCLLFLVASLNGSPSAANSGGPPASRTGAVALGSVGAEQSCVACHSGNPVNDANGTFTITAPATYTPGQDVTVTVTLNRASRQRYGFQLTALTDTGTKAGDLIVTDSARTQLANGNGSFAGRQYIQHTFTGVSPNGTNQNSWTFTWKPPTQSVGKVTFYAAGNAADGTSGTGGDFIYTTSKAIDPAASVTVVTSVSAASFAPSAALTPDMIVAAFGTGLSQNVVQGFSIPLPTQLDGTEVEIKDSTSTDRKAGLFFVSPGQINYLVPTGTANGAATVSVKRSGTTVAQGTITIDSVQPAIFTANANGQGVAAGVILRRRNGVDTFESIITQQGNTFVGAPIDLGPEGDLVLLLAFGTGFRNAPQSSVSVSLGGTPATLVTTGAVAGLVGLDQANILLPRSLIGRGNINVVLTAGGKQANTFTLNIK